MEISHEKTTSIGFGYSTLADAFQAGREAAQMAKMHFPDAPCDMALSIGPSDIHFKDFIEGVRLVVGERTLVGLPAPWVFSSDAPNSRVRTVLLMKCEGQKTSVVCTADGPSPLVASTSIFSELRARRGNARLDHDFHGIVAFDNLPGSRPQLPRILAADAGLESWIAGFGLWPSPAAPMICGPQLVKSGVSVVECLSNGPWGIGWVDTSSFPADLNVRREAARASMREALGQLQSRRPAAGLVLVAAGDEPMSEGEADALFRSASSATPGVPLIAIPVHSPYLRSHGGVTTVATHGVASLLVPQ